MRHSNRWAALFSGAILLAAQGGCSVQGVDPWEKSNRFFYSFNDGLDRVALKPASDAYVAVTPKVVRDCFSNALDNLMYLDVILNDFLQGKVGQGLSDTGRMAANSTAGLGGLFDIATPLNMPAHENDLGITLGKWGVKPGPYIVLPLLGPSTARDLPAIPMGIVTNPMFWIDPPLAASASVGALTMVDGRSRADKEFKFRNAAALDPYVFTRDGYLQYREGLIRDGVPATGPSIYDEDFTPATQPTTQPATQPATRPAS